MRSVIKQDKNYMLCISRKHYTFVHAIYASITSQEVLVVSVGYAVHAFHANNVNLKNVNQNISQLNLHKSKAH